MKRLELKQIFGPLENYQYFPRPYLALVKTFSQLFDYNVLSLRLFPLIGMLLAFFVWVKIYKKEFQDKWQTLLVIFSFTSSYYLSYYAAEFKHYSMDVLTIGLFCLYFSYQKETTDNNSPNAYFVIATLLLPLTILFSYSSFFAFWIVIYNFLIMPKKDYRIIAISIGYTSLCLLAIAFVFWFDLRYTFGAKVTFSYWNDYFLCTNSAYCFIKSFGEGLRKLVIWWFGDRVLLKRIASIFIPFFLFSLVGYGWKSIKRNKFKISSIDALGLILFLELFILGMLKKYPFTGARTSLFISPFVFYFIVKGIGAFKTKKITHATLTIFYWIFIFMCGLNSILTYMRLYD